MSLSGKRPWWSGPWPTDWLFSLTSGLPCHYEHAWWPGLWSEPGCHPHTSAALFAQVIWGGPWLVRPLPCWPCCYTWLVAPCPIPTAQPLSFADAALLLFVVGLQWPFCFPSKAKDFLSLACLSMCFCFLLCPRSCCTLEGFLRGTTNLCMGAGVYLQLRDLRKHRAGEGRVLYGIELPLISWQEENLWVQETYIGQKFDKMMGSPKLVCTTTAKGWERNELESLRFPAPKSCLLFLHIGGLGRKLWLPWRAGGLCRGARIYLPRSVYKAGHYNTSSWRQGLCLSPYSVDHNRILFLFRASRCNASQCL